MMVVWNNIIPETKEEGGKGKTYNQWELTKVIKYVREFFDKHFPLELVGKI